MPRKKKVNSVAEYVPSKYQKAIFDFIQHGQGNAIIEATAGAGKTSTLVWSLKLLPLDAKILVTAFNTDIVEELKKKIKKEKEEHDIDCRTMHSLGYAILMSNYGREIDRKPNDFKYSSYIYNNVKEFGGELYKKLSFNDKVKYTDNIKKLVDLGRCYLAESIKDLEYVETHYSINTYGNEKEVALKVMQWGKENYQTVDFTDMIWLPNVLNCKPYGRIYNWIYLDEAQDTSKAELQLLLRCTNMSTRLLFVGQKIQMIYSFQGNDDGSFDAIKNLPNTISLPLSITYRCAKNIVKLANRFDAQMEPCDDAPDGEVKYGCDIEEIQDGDMILCRVNAPLLQMYCELSKRGKPAYIRGKDIGSSLTKIIEKTKEQYLHVNLKQKGVFSKLYNNLFDDIDRVMKKHKISFEMAVEDSDIAQQYDTIQALEAIVGECEESECLVNTVKTLFSDKKKKGIQLSTIHKAKGLESDNVYICCPSLLPAKSAKEPWELQQESNLQFVAYTRPKLKLGFLKEDGFTMYSSNAQQKASNLQAIKAKVFALYGSKDRCGVVQPTLQAAQHIINNSTNVHVKPVNAISLNNEKKENKPVSISSFKQKSKKKVVRRIRI